MNKNLMIYGILFALTLSFLSNDIQSSSAYALSSEVDETYTVVNLVDDTVIKFSPHSIGVQEERVLATEVVLINDLTHYKIYTTSGMYMIVYSDDMFLIIDGPQQALIKVDRNPEDLKQIQKGNILAITKVKSYVLDIQTNTWGSQIL